MSALYKHMKEITVKYYCSFVSFSRTYICIIIKYKISYEVNCESHENYAKARKVLKTVVLFGTKKKKHIRLGVFGTLHFILAQFSSCNWNFSNATNIFLRSQAHTHTVAFLPRVQVVSAKARRRRRGEVRLWKSLFSTKGSEIRVPKIE